MAADSQPCQHHPGTAGFDGRVRMQSSTVRRILHIATYSSPQSFVAANPAVVSASASSHSTCSSSSGGGGACGGGGGGGGGGGVHAMGRYTMTGTMTICIPGANGYMPMHCIFCRFGDCVCSGDVSVGFSHLSSEARAVRLSRLPMCALRNISEICPMSSRVFV